MNSPRVSHWVWSGVVAIAMLAGGTAQAQVIPDATLGAGNNSVTSTTGNRTDILGGLRRNSSLFHSFDRFDVLTNQQVYFANPADIRNIFSRVTGGSISNIDGLLGVAGSANLFFMNPNGIIFGPNARLDVAGSFFATTANALEFADNQKFAATGDRAVPLVEVNIPIGLQFGANPPAMLTNRGNLTAGQNLTLAAGNLDLQGHLRSGGDLTLNATDTVRIRDTVTEPFLARSGGDMTIQGNQGIDILALNHLSQTPFVSGGNLSLIGNGIISGDAHYEVGGSFSILNTTGGIGDFFSIYDPTVTAAGNVTFGNYTGASLQVISGGSISTGSITINAIDPALDPDNPVLTLRAGVAGNPNNPAFPFPLGGTTFTTAPTSTPAGITVNGAIRTRNDSNPAVPIASRLPLAQPFIVRLSAPGDISTRDIIATSTTTDFAVIDINSTAGSVFLDNVTLSTSNTNATARGGAGDIFINAARNISITNGSSIESNGDLGQIFLANAERVTIDKSSLTAINSSNVPDGTGGRISINVPGNATTPGTINITKSSLRTPSSSLANGGRIDLTVGNVGTITLNSSRVDSSLRGTGNPNIEGVTLTAINGTVNLNTNSLVTTATAGTNTAMSGSPIRVRANTVALSGSSALSATTANTAPGGDISVAATDSLTVRDSSLISTNVQTGAAGVGGDITITTNMLNLLQGGRVEARTSGSGRGGNIQLNVTDRTVIDERDPASQLYSGISTDTRSTGLGGNITFNASSNLIGDLTVSNGGFLSARTSGSAIGGNIAINVNNLNLERGGQVLTTSSGSGNAGSITVNAAGNVTISRSRSALTAPISPFTNPDSTPANFLLSLDALTLNNNADANVEASGTGGIPFISLQRNPSTATTGTPSRIYATQASSGDATGGTVLGAANDFDYYSFSISQDGSQAIFDVDNANSVPGSAIDTEIFLFDALTGQLLDSNDDFFPADNIGPTTPPSTFVGSTSGRDSFLSYNFNLAGRYVLAVGKYNSSTTSTPAAATPPLSGVSGVRLEATDAYRLQVSLQNRGSTNTSLADRNPNQGLNSGLFAQSLSSGNGNSINVTANSFALTNRGELSATTLGQANAGSITVTTGVGTPLLASQNSIQVDNGRIRTSIEPPVDQESAGRPSAVSGNVTLTAQSGSISLTNSNPLSQLEDSTLVSASTAGVGTGGTVTVQTTGGGSISILNGARVESRTSGVGDFSNVGGNAGNVIVNAPDITISGSTSLYNQPIFSGLLASSDTAKSRRGGSITVNSATPGNSLIIQDGGFLSVLNRSDQPGQGIAVNVNRLQLLNGGQIITAAEGRGTAGAIAINSPNVTISGTSGITLPSNTANGGFSLALQDAIDFSTLVPHQTVTGNSGQVAYYQFDNLTAGNRAIFDIDNSAGFNDTELFLFRYDPATNQSFFLARNDDSSAEGAARGSTSGRDSYLDYRFDRPGRYILAVAPYSFGTTFVPGNPSRPSVGQPVVTPTFLDASRQYTLQISIDQRNTFNPNSSTNSGLFAQSSGGDAGTITVNGGGSGQITLTNGAQISADTNAGGASSSSDITLQGLQTLTVNNSFISSSTNSGTAGSVTVDATGSVMLDGTFPGSNGIVQGGVTAVARQGGSAGSVTITTPTLAIANGASVAASSTGAGTAGDVTVNATSAVTLNNGTISATTESGRSGNILVNGGGNTQVSLQSAAQISASNTSSRAANAGNITLQGLGTLQVTNSQIASTTQTGDAGNVTVNAARQVNLDGTYNGIVPGSITAAATQGGDAGDVTITAPTLAIANGASVAVSSAIGSGTAGSIAINARNVTLNNAAQISAETDAGGGGASSNAANITLDGLQTLTVNNSLISSSTNSGTAGDITVNATGQVLLNGTSNALLDRRTNQPLAGIVAEAREGGTAGDVTITAGQVRVQNGARASVSSPTGPAGNLTLITPDLRLDRGTLSANTGGSGSGSASGANILLRDLQAPLIMRNGSLISANARDQANGGNITIGDRDSGIFPAFIIGPTFENNDIVANAIAGNGGQINITTNAIFGLQFRRNRTNRSDITASSETGSSGTVALNTLNIDPSKGLVELPEIPVDRANQLTQGCSTSGDPKNNESRFSVAGRGGVPASPTTPFTAAATASDWVSLDPSPQALSGVTFSNGITMDLVAQSDRIPVTCVNAWKLQQRSLLPTSSTSSPPATAHPPTT